MTPTDALIVVVSPDPVQVQGLMGALGGQYRLSAFDRIDALAAAVHGGLAPHLCLLQGVDGSMAWLDTARALRGLCRCPIIGWAPEASLPPPVARIGAG